MKDFFIILIFISILFGAFFAVASTNSFQEKLAKQDLAKLQSLCKQSGQAMNKYYGKEICPPEFMQ